ncbi:hypothetical protein SLA2020_029340 [Shorea laevis]
MRQREKLYNSDELEARSIGAINPRDQWDIIAPTISPKSRIPTRSWNPLDTSLKNIISFNNGFPNGRARCREGRMIIREIILAATNITPRFG